MNKNDKVQVSSIATHHANRIGYFQFEGEGESVGTVVLSEQPVKCCAGNSVLFAVSVNDVKRVA